MIDRKTVKILIAEDAFPIRMILKSMLVDAGFKSIVEAGNGAEAWRLIENEVPTIAILDWMMPEMSGLEVLQKIRGDERFKTLPVIMVTGEREKDKVVAAIKSGANDYIVKPVSAATLVNKIVAVLGKTMKT